MCSVKEDVLLSEQVACYREQSQKKEKERKSIRLKLKNRGGREQGGGKYVYVASPVIKSCIAAMRGSPLRGVTRFDLTCNE